MRLLIDFDGVCADTIKYWLGLYNKEYEDSLAHEHIMEWDVHKFVKEQCGNRIYKYLDHSQFFSNVEMLPDADAVLFRLQEKGHQIIITTAIGTTSPTSFYDKRQWIAKNFPFLPPKNFIASELKDVIKGDLLLDDGPHNLEVFPGITCAFNWPWNQGAKCDYRVNSWLEFEDVVNSIK